MMIPQARVMIKNKGTALDNTHPKSNFSHSAKTCRKQPIADKRRQISNQLSPVPMDPHTAYSAVTQAKPYPQMDIFQQDHGHDQVLYKASQ